MSGRLLDVRQERGHQRGRHVDADLLGANLENINLEGADVQIGPNPPRDLEEFMKAWNDMLNSKSIEDRRAAFARGQARILDQVLALPFGSLTKVQAVRANVEGFKPFRIPRMSNVWIKS